MRSRSTRRYRCRVVPFYGRQPASSEISKIQAPLLLHYAGLDERINAGIPEYEQALKDAGVDYMIHISEGVNHAFHNDTLAGTLRSGGGRAPPGRRPSTS